MKVYYKYGFLVSLILMASNIFIWFSASNEDQTNASKDGDWFLWLVTWVLSGMYFCFIIYRSNLTKELFKPLTILILILLLLTFCTPFVFMAM